MSQHGHDIIGPVTEGTAAGRRARRPGPQGTPRSPGPRASPRSRRPPCRWRRRGSRRTAPRTPGPGRRPGRGSGSTSRSGRRAGRSPGRGDAGATRGSHRSKRRSGPRRGGSTPPRAWGRAGGHPRPSRGRQTPGTEEVLVVRSAVRDVRVRPCVHGRGDGGGGEMGGVGAKDDDRDTRGEGRADLVPSPPGRGMQQDHVGAPEGGEARSEPICVQEIGGEPTLQDDAGPEETRESSGSRSPEDGGYPRRTARSASRACRYPSLFPD